MAQIRQEINFADGTRLSSSGAVWNGIATIDTTKYNGTVTYYFEVVAKVDSGTGTVKLRNITDGTDAVTITGITATGYTLYRSASFTPTTGSKQYQVGVGGGGIDVTYVKASRVVIIQNATTITNTQTQIEIGNEATTTSTTNVPTTNPKYWKYTSANWDGTITAYFEATLACSSSKSATTAVLQTSTSITAPSWSDVASSTITTTTAYNSSSLVRSGAITLTAGNWYRVAYKSGTSKSAAYIWNAKIVIDQYGDSGVPAVMDSCTGTSTSNENQDSATYTRRGQSFTSMDGVLDSCSFNLAKVGSPGGNVTASLYAHSGTYGTSSLPTGSPLATSDNVDVSTLSTSQTNQTFNFSGANRYTLVSGTQYVIVVDFAGGDSSNYVRVGEVTGGHGGNGSRYFSPTWTVEAGSRDVLFAVYTLPFTKLEPQYLLANTLFTAGTSLQLFQTTWDSTEWSGVTNTYYFQAEAANDSTSDVTLEQADGGGTVTNSTLTNIDNAQISAAMTMPASENLDVKATTNAGDIAAARILVATVVGVEEPVATTHGEDYFIITS